MRGALLSAALAGALLLGVRAEAQPVEDAGAFSVDAGGNVKSLFVGLAPWEGSPFLDEPLGIGLLTSRLSLEASAADVLSFEVQPFLAASTSGGLATLGLFAIGLTGPIPLPQAVNLTWAPVQSPAGSLALRIDRLSLKASVPFVDVIVGRQALSFGQMLFFPVLDIVTPFPPTTLDREFKPGSDAVRGDLYFGATGVLTAAAVYAGSYTVDGLILAARARQTFGPFDIAALAARNRGAPVVGLGAAGDVGGLGVRGEATLTFLPGEDAFVKAGLGVTGRFANLTLIAEGYHQTIGADSPDQYLEVGSTVLALRGDLLLLAHSYVAVSTVVGVTPTLLVSLCALGNLDDASWLVGPGLNWAVADNAELTVGVGLPLGQRPLGAADIRSEFGTLPYTGSVQTRLYF